MNLDAEANARKNRKKVKKLINNLKFKNKFLKKPKLWEPLILDRIAAELVIDNQKDFPKDSTEKRRERLKMIKERLGSSDIRPAIIESYINAILISWMPRGGLVLCKTYEEYRDLCLEFSEYLDSILEINLQLSRSTMTGTSSIDEYDIEEETEFLKPEFSKSNFNYQNEIKIFKGDLKI
jgi:hypothetical protein